MIQRTEARRLSSKNEWSLIESSLPPVLGTLSEVRLKSKIRRARKLREKYQDLYRRQKLSSKSRRTGHPHERLNIRTARKKQMFHEAIGRLQLQLGKLSRRTKVVTRPQRRKVATTSMPGVQSISRRRTYQTRGTVRDKTSSSPLPIAIMRRSVADKRRHSRVAAAGRRQQLRRDLRHRP